MSFTVIIPARYGSTRLEGKPLLDIAGKTMIERVYRQAQLSDAVAVIVATDDQRIVDTVESFGGDVMLTAVDHNSGTDRLQEVAALKHYDDQHIVVNVQGDEPLIPAEAINQVAENLRRHPQAGIATLCERIVDREEIFDPNAVKVVRNANDFADYFSRAPIPWLREWQVDSDAPLHQLSDQAIGSDIKWYRHIGIYGYRVDVLHQYVSWPVCALERAESLEQLRALDNGILIHCAETQCGIPGGVDTAADLARVREHFASS